MDSRIIQEFAVVARKIWWRRNKFLFEGTFAHPNAVVREARGTLDMLVEEESRLARGQTNTQVEDWQAPPSNWIKLNWDSAVDKVNGVIGVGVTVRDSIGYTIATKQTNKILFPDPLLAEAFGALKAVQFGVELGLSQVVVEGDSLQVINALRSDIEGCNSVSMYVSEAKLILQNFAKWEVSHVRRNGNTMAHLLAKEALSIHDDIVTMGVLPSCFPLD
ncbi:hypothetical protein F2P56_012522 [Juglans regia]|uniref:RNase H type-1 domain-containing protein n=1 Tax=Juglans regia TaxID=51240 RepID=A0A834CX56_JUGRE|nr:hypothetical protein F2P56_012522 [Juglans regia]